MKAGGFSPGTAGGLGNGGGGDDDGDIYRPPERVGYEIARKPCHISLPPDDVRYTRLLPSLL